MSFFRKWKTHYRHKKFKSDEDVTEEGWDPEQLRQDPRSVENLKLYLDSHAASAASEKEKPQYNLKYLGCAPIEAKRTEKIVSDAIDTVIANSKAGGRKIKSQRRVNLNILEDSIEVVDATTHDVFMRFSIYDISYCSVDAAHDHAFAFVGAEKDPLTNADKLSCHVFHCPKRKIAHDISLTVASAFQKAFQYQFWSKQETSRVSESDDASKLAIVNDNLMGETSGRLFLQQNWVSFDEDTQPHSILGH